MNRARAPAVRHLSPLGINCTATSVPTMRTKPRTLSTAVFRPRKLGLIGGVQDDRVDEPHDRRQYAPCTAGGLWPRLVRSMMMPVTAPIVSRLKPSVTETSVRCSSRSRLAEVRARQRRPWSAVGG